MNRIEIDPEICGGKPVIRGTRIMVRNIAGMIAGGYSAERIVASYPELCLEDVAAAIGFGKRRRKGRRGSLETGHLLNSRENAARLMRSIEEASGDGSEEG